MFVYVLYSVTAIDLYKEIYGVLSSKQQAVKIKEHYENTFPTLNWKIEKFELDNNKLIKS